MPTVNIFTADEFRRQAKRLMKSTNLCPMIWWNYNGCCSKIRFPASTWAVANEKYG